MKILVTGGTGFVGTHLVSRLAELGHEVISTGTHPEKRLEGVKYAARSLEGLDWTVCGGVDVLFHQGANTDTMCFDNREMLRDNLYGPIRLFHTLLKGGCKKFIYASSCATYGDAPAPYVEYETVQNPLNIYGESKMRLELFAQPFGEEHNVQVIGLRYPNVFGPGEAKKNRRASMITQIMQKMAKEKQPARLFKSGEQVRDYIYVKDVVEANIRAMNSDVSGLFNCAIGEPTSFNRIVEVINGLIDKPIPPEYIDNPHPEKFQNHTECDITRLKTVLKFTPRYDVEHGINDYFRNHIDTL